MTVSDDRLGREFLGVGWAFPPRIDSATGLPARVSYEEDVQQSILIILTTAKGERVMRPDFGCGLKQLVFMPASDALAASTQQLVQGALMRWLEGVIAIEQVACTIGDAAIEVMVVWRRLDTGDRQEGRFVREAVVAP